MTDMTTAAPTLMPWTESLTTGDARMDETHQEFVDMINKLLATPEKGEKPSFATPSRESVARTSRKHPKAQCRLDTYFEGALCPENRDPSIIPAKRLAGYFGTFFNRRAEKQAASQSCHSAEGYFEGVRPRCWFAPVWMGEQ